MKKPVYIFCFLFTPLFAFPQQSKIDSLLSILKTAKEDTNKVNILNALSKQLWQGGRNYDTAFIYAENAKRLAQKINFKKGIAQSYNNIGIIYKEQGNYPEGLKNHFTALKIREEARDKQGIAASYNNIGNIYYEQGNYPNALKEHFACLKIMEEIGNKQGIAASYNNIGIIYEKQGNYSDALKNHFAALKIRKEIGDKQGIADSYNNIGIIYKEQGNYPEALKNHFACLKIMEEIGNKERIVISYGNIGLVYYEQGNYPEALKNDFTCLKIMEEIGDKQGIADSYDNIGNIYYEQGKAHPNPFQRDNLYSEALKKYFACLKIREGIGDKQGIADSYYNIGSAKLKLNNTAEAKKYLQNALSFSKEIGSKDRIKGIYSRLAEIDSVQGNYKSAYENYKMYILYRDSLLNEENTKKTVQTQMQYEFDKKESLTKAEQEKKDALANEEKKKQKMFLFSVIASLLLVAVFSVFMFNRWRVTQKQKKIIEVQKHLVDEQKKLVEEKNKDITDSINYAQRIQRALLASDSLLAPALKREFAQDYFILFKPKDIVSGDFYWATKVLPNGEDLGGASRFYLAVCDSTGHGVPGAFMSLLNISFLNEAINQEEIIQPNEIFNHVRQRLIENISQDGRQDGMDGILVCFDRNSKTISYAGANNSPMLMNGTLQKLDTDSMPVGLGEKKDSFKLHSILTPSGGGGSYFLSLH